MKLFNGLLISIFISFVAIFISDLSHAQLKENVLVSQLLQFAKKSPTIPGLNKASIQQSNLICDDVSNEIYETSKNPNYPSSYSWKSIKWLDSNLNLTLKKTVMLKTYQWGEYQVETENDKIVRTTGTPPGLVKFRLGDKANETIQLLGKPDSIHAHEAKIYSWQCPASQTNITVVATSDSSDLDFSGRSCMLSTCHEFTLTNAPHIKIKKNNVSNDTQSGASDTLQANTKFFKQEFDKDFKTQAEIDNFVRDANTDFADKLKKCAPGNYIVPVLAESAIQYSLEIYTISGFKNGKCSVESTIKSSDNEVKAQCQYSQNSLNYYANLRKDAAMHAKSLATPQDLGGANKFPNECTSITMGISKL